MSELRRDPILNRWVIISPERGARPRVFTPPLPSYEKGKEECPFCAEYDLLTPTEPQVKVVPNKYPFLFSNIPLIKEGEGMYDKMSGFGYHEIIIESPKHDENFITMSHLEIKPILRVYKEKMKMYKELLKEEIRYVLIYKNYGYAAGAQISHPHSHIVALPIVPKSTQEETKGAQWYYNYKNRCIYCDIVREELRLKERLILENKNFVAFIPFAPRFSYEVWIVGIRHEPFYFNITDDEIDSLAKIISELFLRISRILGDPPYNLIMHNAFFGKEEIEVSYHWHIEIIPQLVKLAGFEWGSGFYITPIIPEEAAKAFREA
jgi:UDPglucose--hexose-1-phosphate uridylyltransferase